MCKVPISIGKHHKQEDSCDVIDMDASHMLLGRFWQYDTNATYKGHDNVYLFNWGSHKIAMAPVSDCGKLQKPKNYSFLVMSNNEKEFEEDIKEVGVLYHVYVKELLIALPEGVSCPREVKKILIDFQELISHYLPNELPPMRDIQYQIDLVPRVSLPNIPHYRMSPKENEILREKIKDLMQKWFI